MDASDSYYRRPEWSDYSVEVNVKPLNLAEMAGLTFRYHTNRHYYLFALAGGNKVRLALHQPLEPKLRVHGRKELASADFPYDTKRYYLLKVETEGPDIRAYIDGKLILEASDSDLPKGKAGVIAGGPARFEDFHVFTPDAEAREITENIHKRDAELIRLRNENPKPKLWKKFETPIFGVGRNARFGDLDADGTVDMLIGQKHSARAGRRLRSNQPAQASACWP